MNGERFCHYCRRYRTDEGFKPVFDPARKSRRMQCVFCRMTRQRPRIDLENEAKQEREARNLQISAETKRGIADRDERRRQGLLDINETGEEK